MSTYIVTIDNYGGMGYLPDTEPTEFDNLTEAAEYLHDEIRHTVETFIEEWDDCDIPAVETIVKSVQNDGEIIVRIGNVHHYLAKVL